MLKANQIEKFPLNIWAYIWQALNGISNRDRFLFLQNKQK